MALVLNATPGDAAANSYATEAEGDTYHESHLYGTDWTDATEAVKAQALVWATRLLDQGILWDGLKASSAQPLKFPRQLLVDEEGNTVSSATIPSWLRDATAEFARWLIASNRLAERETMGFSKLKVGSLELVTDKHDSKSIIPNVVMQMVADYGRRKFGRNRLVKTRGSSGSGDNIVTSII